MDLGRTGIWSFELRMGDAGMIRDAAAELDEMGWGALWIPGMGGGDILIDSERVLHATRNTKVAVGVLSIWRHGASEIAAGHATLQAEYDRRLLLGLGVSDPAAASAAGRPFSPLSDMGSYLDMLDEAPDGVPRDERVMAAMGPRMVQLAGRRAAGVHPFAVTPEYCAATRELLGPSALLAPYQAVILEQDKDKARAAARGFIATFLAMGHYERSLRRQGFTGADQAAGGSDRLVDSIVAWGGVDAIAARLRDHHDAGANHVCLHVIPSTPGLPVTQWRELAALAH